MINVPELFKRFEDEFLHFERVGDRDCSSPDLCAFLMLDRLLPSERGADMIAAAGHDQLWLRPSIERLNEVLTEEDVLFLARCGVFFDDTFESLSMWV